MRHRFSYELDPYLTEITSRVIGAGEAEGRPYVVLTDTVLYPEGGGQPADRGSIAGIAVTDVRRGSDGIRHILAAPAPRGPVTIRLDWGRRFGHMQQHTAQHLLTAVAHDRFGWPTTAFHLGSTMSDIELATPSIAPDAVSGLEEEVAAEIRRARPVTSRWVPSDNPEVARARTRGLPDGHTGDVRLVEIAGVDLNTCGGTHVRSTSEIEAVSLLFTEAMRGGTRLFFVAGARLRSRMTVHETRTGRLRAVLQAPDDELATVAEAKLAALQLAEHRLRRTEDQLADATATSLAAGGARRVTDAHFGERDVAFLQRLGRRVATLRPDAVALLTADAPAGGCLFLLVAGDEAGVDVPLAGREVATILGGRGGGTGALFQGKCDSLRHREQAITALRDAVRPPDAG